MHELTGGDGELIGRLVEIADAAPPDDPHWWLDVTGIVAAAVGGCDHLAPESDRIAGGTFHWEHFGNREVVARITWMNHLRLRLASLVEFGVAEDFLVASLRELVGRELPRLSNRSATTPVERTRYDEWIAEQASGDNLELSLVARALMGPSPDVDLTSAPAGSAWPVAASPVGDAEIARWRDLRSSAVQRG